MEIRTHRLRLRDFCEGDAEAMAAYQADPRYLAEYGAYQGERLPAEEIVQMAIRWAGERPRTHFQLAVEDKAGRMIGSVGLRQASTDASEADIGGELTADHWRQGYGTEAGEALIAFAFETLGLERVRIVTVNPGAHRVAAALGFTQVSVAEDGTTTYVRSAR